MGEGIVTEHGRKGTIGSRRTTLHPAQPMMECNFGDDFE